MDLKAVYDNEDEIPEKYKELFTEKRGKWELTIAGIKTQADIDRQQVGLEKEREEHRKTKDALAAWTSLNMKPEEIHEKLDRFDELETKAASAGKLNDEQIDKIVEGRIKTKLAPVERERDRFKTELATSQGRIQDFEGKERQRRIHDTVRAAAVKLKLLPSAIDDALTLAERLFEVPEDGAPVIKDQVGFTPGVSAEDWLGEIQEKRPHWWPDSQGGGANGGRGKGGLINNPWSKSNWNITRQGQYVREHGEEKAKQAASSAGSSVGSVNPPA